MKKLLSILLLTTVLNLQAQVTVGFDATCDYDESVSIGQIQQAIDDGETEIRLTNEQAFTTQVNILNSVIIKGGYDSCTMADAGTQSSTKTLFDGTSLNKSLFLIYSDFNHIIVSIDNLELKNSSGGTGSGNPNIGTNFAGGITIFKSSGEFNLTDMKIHNNRDNSFHGGIAITNNFIESVNTNLTLNIVDSMITNNSSGYGAGIACFSKGSATINISGDSGISYNFAQNNGGSGGGLLLDHCNLNMSSGTSTPDIIAYGIHGNKANGNGGGIRAYNGSQIYLIGSALNPVNVTSNFADFDNISYGDGGGINIGYTDVAITPAQVNLFAENVIIADNTSNQDGGGIYLEWGVHAEIKSTIKGCEYSEFCSLISGNKAQNGGAFGIDRASTVILTGVEIKNNRTKGSGSIANLYNDDNSLLEIEASLIHHNGGSDHSVYADAYGIRNSFGNNKVSIAYSTMVDNEIQYASIAPLDGSGAQGDIVLIGSIIDDSGINALNFPVNAPSSDINCVILGDATWANMYPTVTHVIETTPQFVDRAAGNYHLDTSNSMAIDQCENSLYTITATDMDGETRGFDLDDYSNNPGSNDIGVDEANDLIFKSSFD